MGGVGGMGPLESSGGALSLAGAGGIAAGAPGASGSAGQTGAAGQASVDRCVTPGPPPDQGAAGESDYRLGTPIEIADDYYGYLAVADIDGNGRPDVLASDYFTPLMSFRQLQPGSFDEGTEGIDLSEEFGPSYGLHVADINHDQAPDALVARGLEQGLGVFLNDGKGQLSNTGSLTGESLFSPLSFDVDGDGDLDVLAIGSDAATDAPGHVSIYTNEAGSLSFDRNLPLPVQGRQLRVADVTGDMIPELLMMQFSPTRVSILTQNDFQELTLLDEVTTSGTEAWHQSWFNVGDLDGDALNDLVIVEDERTPDIEAVWVSYQRDGALGPAQVADTLPKGGGNIAGGEVIISDMNLDGRNDIVITSSAFDMVVELQNRFGGFWQVAKPYPTHGSVIDTALAVGDLNCDGCPDAVGMQVGHIVIFPGTGCAR
jgi:hypothetical protein